MMPFQLPGFHDVIYRLWRLRRIIVLGSLIPVAIYAMFYGVVALFTGVFSGNILAVSTFCFLVVAVHAVVFPNVVTETIMASLALVVLILAAPLAGGSVLGWLLGWPALILAAMIFAVWGQGRLLNWQMGSAKAANVLEASIAVSADPETALQAFAPRPNRDEDDHKSGGADEGGFFPVLLKQHVNDLDAGADDELDAAWQDEVREQQEALNKELGDDALVLMANAEIHPDLGAVPSYWAQIIEQSPDYQKTNVLLGSSVDDLTLHSVIEHRAKKKGSGCVVTETESVEGFQQGLGLGMWASEYQLDGLVMVRDRIEGKPKRALRLQHTESLLSLIGRAFVRHQMRSRTGDSFDDDPE